MGGWIGDYDRDGQNNREKRAGRKLHVQDVYWTVSKPALVIYAVIVFIIIVTTGPELIDGLRRLIAFAR